MQEPDTLNTFEFFKKFPDEEAARNFFESRRWGSEPICGHCGSVSVTECKDHKPMAYRCKDCRAHFSVRTGTVLAESRLPLLKWLLAINMLTSAREDIPLIQMARELGITQKSAWFLSQRIRETWLKDNSGGDDNIGDHVQVDEAYIGSDESNKHADKKLHARRVSVGQVVRNMAHTNRIESFWALLKRGHFAMYHYMSAKHLNYEEFIRG